MSGQLRLGVIPTVAPYLLPRALPLMRERFPEIGLELREAHTPVLLDELSSGGLDLLLLSLPVEVPGIETLPLFDDRFLLAVQADPGIDERRRVDPASLASERLLLLSEGHCLRDQALALCRHADREAMGELGATSLATIVQMVANGLGTTLLPQMAVDAEIRNDRITLLRFQDPEPVRSIGLAWRRTSSRKREFATIGEALRELAT